MTSLLNQLIGINVLWNHIIEFVGPNINLLTENKIFPSFKFSGTISNQKSEKKYFSCFNENISNLHTWFEYLIVNLPKHPQVPIISKCDTPHVGTLKVRTFSIFVQYGSSTKFQIDWEVDSKLRINIQRNIKLEIENNQKNRLMISEIARRLISVDEDLFKISISMKTKALEGFEYFIDESHTLKRGKWSQSFPYIDEVKHPINPYLPLSPWDSRKSTLPDNKEVLYSFMKKKLSIEFNPECYIDDMEKHNYFTFNCSKMRGKPDSNNTIRMKTLFNKIGEIFHNCYFFGISISPFHRKGLCAPYLSFNPRKILVFEIYNPFRQAFFLERCVNIDIENIVAGPEKDLLSEIYDEFDKYLFLKEKIYITDESNK